jgi:hypothetical protein
VRRLSRVARIWIIVWFSVLSGHCSVRRFNMVRRPKGLRWFKRVDWSVNQAGGMIRRMGRHIRWTQRRRNTRG